MDNSEVIAWEGSIRGLNVNGKRYNKDFIYITYIYEIEQNKRDDIFKRHDYQIRSPTTPNNIISKKQMK